MNDLLKLMFKEGEGICVGNQYKSEVSTKPNISSRTAFYSVNPLDPNIDHGYEQKEQYKRFKPRRADINVSAFRNFIFEMDSVALEDQLRILSETEIDFSGIVYSGGKSYHAIIALDASIKATPNTVDGIQRYKSVWLQVANLINQTAKDMGFDHDVVDPSCKNPSRLTRMPGSIRDNEKKQELKYLGKQMSSTDFKALLERCPKVYKPAISLAKTEDVDFDIEDVDDFMRAIPKGLYLMIKYPDWIQADGNYPNLLRIVLWGIDSIAAPKDVAVEVCEKYIFPEFLATRYPKHKWMTAIDDAYKMKGM